MTVELLWDRIGGGPIVYLAPHSDDAAFSSAGLLHACGRRGVAVHIVTCFSVSAHSRTMPGAGAAHNTEIRKAEDRAFASSLPGPVALRWLDLADAPLRPAHAGKHPCKETSMTAADAALASEIAAVAEDVAGASGWVLAPLGLGRHIDHLIVRDAGAALASSGRIDVAFWEDLPYAGRVPLAALDHEIVEAQRAAGLSLAPCLVTDPRMEAVKAAALACYPSQTIDVHRRGVLEHLARVSGSGAPAERLWLRRRG